MDASGRSRPRDVGGILEETLRLYQRNYQTFLVILAVIQIPLVVVQILFQVSVAPFAPAGDPTPAQVVSMLTRLCGLGGLFALVMFVANAAMYAAVVLAAGRAHVGAAPEPMAAYNEVLGRLGAIVGAVFLASLAVGLLSLTIIGIPFAIYLGIRWIFINQAVMLEDRGATAALSRSSELVKGSWWRVFGIALLLGVVQGIVIGLGSSVVGAVVSVFAPGPVGTAIANAFAGAIMTILVGAFALIGLTILYYDLRVRKEGFGGGEAPTGEAPY